MAPRDIWEDRHEMSSFLKFKRAHEDGLPAQCFAMLLSLYRLHCRMLVEIQRAAQSRTAAVSKDVREAPAGQI
jgi:hypothetical protein